MTLRKIVLGLLGTAPLALPALAEAPDDGTAEPEWYSLHAQFTNVTQYHPSFNSDFRGQNSLDPGHRGDETNDATLFAGIRLWQGGEFYADAEIDQGFGLSNTLGLAGFSSGEAYKVGQSFPYIRLPRAFFRQSFGLGGESQAVEPDKNQLGGTQMSDNIVVTLGKFSVTDIFDNNSYAHDPRADFLNWSIIDAGAFDYAADAWGYSYGGAVEWTQSWWTLRGGLFDLSRVPNSKFLERGFGQYELVLEAEERHTLADQPGKVKLLAYVNRGDMADYNDAVRAAAGTGQAPSVADVRRYGSRPGVSLNAEQQIVPDLGAFLRASLADGHKEAYEFTEIDQSVSGGLAWKGGAWGRPNDTIGLAGVANGLSRDARNYFAAGGLGILIGDGALVHYGWEKIVETYYSAAVIDGITISADYQYVVNPAYNRDRGPVSIFGLRLHAEI
ncbi:MAG TPA: carbohydrate porin [Aliidongia sp.]|nr:carbohydrate porin [Aliidongia sp.]